MSKSWSIEVKHKHESLIIIERNYYAGKSEFTKEEESVIRNAAQELLAFIGEEEMQEPLSNDGIPF